VVIREGPCELIAARTIIGASYQVENISVLKYVHQLDYCH
jgi:hypothetical protein